MNPFCKNISSIGLGHTAELFKMSVEPNAGRIHPCLSDVLHLELLRKHTCSQAASQKTSSHLVDGRRNDKSQREA